VEGSCEHGNGPSGSIKCWEILEQLCNWRLLKKDSAPRSSLVAADKWRTPAFPKLVGREPMWSVAKWESKKTKNKIRKGYKIKHIMYAVFFFLELLFLSSSKNWVAVLKSLGSTGVHCMNQ
jgi:hypothetical protein